MPSVAGEARVVRRGEVTSERSFDVARERAATYWLLSRLVHEPPTPALLDELQLALSESGTEERAPLTAEVLELLVAVDAARSGIPAEMELRAEHTRLWGGVAESYGPPPPFESVVLEQRLPGEATTAVAAAYEAAGLEAQIDDAGPADHLASELRFMGLCALREAEAWEGDREAEALEWQDRQREFLDEHLLAWAPAHCSKVADMAQTEYHRAVATLVAGACRLDAEVPGDAMSTCPA